MNGRRRRQPMTLANAALIGSFILGIVLVLISMIPGLNDLALAGVALFIPVACALALDLAAFILKDLS